MLAKDLLKSIGINSNDTKDVTGISFNSKNIEEGDIFIAYKGNNSDGNDYISEAFNKGATCVVSDRLVGYDIYKSNNIEEDKITLSKLLFKSKKIKLIGITGTNGKTSTAHLLYQSLNFMGIRATYIGTLGVIDREYKKTLDNTTPDMDVLIKEINKAIERKCKYIVMEVSSHALSMNRLAPFSFDVVAFSNLSQDHLDYYKDMGSYFKAKKLLFDNASSNCIGVVNNEDKRSIDIVKDFKGKVVRYGKGSEYSYKLLKNTLSGLKFKVNEDIISSKLIYKTNMYNLLLVYVILLSLGHEKQNAINAISNCECIEGRMEIISNKNKTVVLDYAHTPDALKRILIETKKINKGKVVVLFGCGGNRDKTKRQIMGKYAREYADLIYLTNDNPRDEEPLDIINDILKGMDTTPIIELDREIAISSAIERLTKDDILLVLGKGHEDYQIIKNNKLHLSDREIIQKCLER